MTATSVPFFSNTPDNMHCFQASMLSVLGYFVPNESFTIEQLEQLSAKKPGMATWPTQMVLNLVRMGFDIAMIEGFDGADFAKNGATYLRHAFGDEASQWQIKHSDIAAEQKLYKSLLESNVSLEVRAPDIVDITSFIDKGYVVQSTVNLQKLNGKKGYSGHSVLVYTYDTNGLYMHDPGLPPVESRYVPNDDFIQAWADPDKNAKNLIAIKLGSKGFTHV